MAPITISKHGDDTLSRLVSWSWTTITAQLDCHSSSNLGWRASGAADRSREPDERDDVTEGPGNRAAQAGNYRAPARREIWLRRLRGADRSAHAPHTFDRLSVSETACSSR